MHSAITSPLQLRLSRFKCFTGRRARYLVAIAWLLALAFSLPILWLYEEKLIQGHTQCWIEFTTTGAWQLYMCLVSATLFLLPALIISACYATIVRTIWAKGALFGHNVGIQENRVNRCNNHLDEIQSRRASSRGIIPRAKVKTVKMTLVIVVVFILCWSPYIIFDLLQVFGHVPQTQTNIAIATLIQSLAPLNSAANPLIYCLFSSTVFRTFR